MVAALGPVPDRPVILSGIDPSALAAALPQKRSRVNLYEYGAYTALCSANCGSRSGRTRADNK